MALLTTTLWPGAAQPALPSATPDQLAAKPELAAAPADSGINWFLPPVRIGGVVSYNIRADNADGQSNRQQGITSTLQASTNSYIWQPWFSRISGALGVSLSRNSSSGSGFASSSKSVFLTGNGQLSLVPMSPYPFEAHFERSDSRTSNDLALANGFAGQRYGFTQNYFSPGRPTATFGWDRSTQTSDANGSDRQDSLRLNLAHTLGKHRLQLIGDGTRNTHERSGEQALQNNLTLQHSVAPSSAISVENMANVSRSSYHLQGSDNASRLMQLSTMAFWRPEEQPFTVTGGARMFALGSDTSGPGIDSNTFNARVRTGNANLGVNYEVNRFTRINAGVNVNLSDNNGVKSNSANETVGASYTPAQIDLSGFQYGWSTSASGSNQSGEQGAVRQLSLQLSHNLGRSIMLDGGSSVGINASQSVSAAAVSGAQINEEAASKHLTNNASVSWDMARDAGSAQVRLSASDSRSLGGRAESFQLVNLQASSSLPAGKHGSFTGSLTTQAVRQSENTILITDPLTGLVSTPLQFGVPPKKSFDVTSSAAISYQNQRVWNIPRLRFVSDLRLNSQALLPLLGSARDQETAAWDSRFDYMIGRTQLRLSFLIARSKLPVLISIDPVTGLDRTESVSRTNKSIMFSISRGFGAL